MSGLGFGASQHLFALLDVDHLLGRVLDDHGHLLAVEFAHGIGHLLDLVVHGDLGGGQLLREVAELVEVLHVQVVDVVDPDRVDPELTLLLATADESLVGLGRREVGDQGGGSHHDEPHRLNVQFSEMMHHLENPANPGMRVANAHRSLAVGPRPGGEEPSGVGGEAILFGSLIIHVLCLSFFEK